MSEIAQRTVKPMAHEDDYDRENMEATGWVGWIGFGAVIMILTGMFQAITGLVAIFRDSFFVVNSNQVLVFGNVHAWGWANLIIGSIVMLAGLSLLSGSMWARVAAVLVAMSAAVTNLVGMSLYPVWSVIGVLLSVLVIYAVIVHGGEMRERS
jgi:hypothetical protein